MDPGALIIIAIILFNIIRSFNKASKDAKKKSAKNRPTPTPQQQQSEPEGKGKLEDWLGDYLEQIEDAVNEQQEKSVAEELREEQSHSVFEKDEEEAAHYEEEKQKHFKLRDEKDKHKHSDLYKGKVNKDFFEERKRIAKSRKRIEYKGDNSAFDLTKKKSIKKQDTYQFNAKEAVIGSIILERYEDPMKRLEKF